MKLSEISKKIIGDDVKMEKWLQAFADGLLIQKNTDEGRETKQASAEQIEKFKQALRENLNFHRDFRSVGDTITYDYLLGVIRGGSQIHEPVHVITSSATLTSIFEKMPKLPEGEHYSFPVPTFITFKVIGKNGNDDDLEISDVCYWIQKNL